MSQVDAYRCDFCDQLRPAAEILGVHATTDLYHWQKSYPIEKLHPEKCKAHFCITCYNEQVFKAADRFANRGKDRDKWQGVADKLSYNLRKSIITKVFAPDDLLKTKKKPV